MDFVYMKSNNIEERTLEPNGKYQRWQSIEKKA
jgi:hypothetical protein